MKAPVDIIKLSTMYLNMASVGKISMYMLSGLRLERGDSVHACAVGRREGVLDGSAVVATRFLVEFASALLWPHFNRI